jgi:radical SAM/Cys-rich protein
MSSRNFSLIPQDGGTFSSRLAADGLSLARESLRTLQLNLGKMCNLACHHCHVEAGPKRMEIMPQDVMTRVLGWLDLYRAELGTEVVDLTGGAPEMNPHFRWLVRELRGRGVHVLDRCNLTILLEPEFEDLIDFLASMEVEIVASLPCYLEENVDKQRGRGVFDGSVEALRRLNRAGYGRPGSGLRLDLVYNPTGWGLPPPQEPLEQDYRRELGARFGLHFNRLWTITNMPIKRFDHALRREGRREQYMTRLRNAHNPANVANVMCRSLVSVGWLGTVYDCDFNQMLALPTGGSDGPDERVEREARKLWEFHPSELIGRAIRTGDHCFGCTAGAGSSCTGALA